MGPCAATERGRRRCSTAWSNSGPSPAEDSRPEGAASGKHRSDRSLRILCGIAAGESHSVAAASTGWRANIEGRDVRTQMAAVVAA